jgi:hypothetical protein
MLSVVAPCNMIGFEPSTSTSVAKRSTIVLWVMSFIVLSLSKEGATTLHKDIQNSDTQHNNNVKVIIMTLSITALGTSMLSVVLC